MHRSAPVPEKVLLLLTFLMMYGKRGVALTQVAGYLPGKGIRHGVGRVGRDSGTEAKGERLLLQPEGKGELPVGFIRVNAGDFNEGVEKQGCIFLESKGNGSVGNIPHSPGPVAVHFLCSLLCGAFCHHRVGSAASHHIGKKCRETSVLGYQPLEKGELQMTVCIDKAGVRMPLRCSSFSEGISCPRVSVTSRIHP